MCCLIDPADLLTDIYFYFNKSSLRFARFSSHNKEQLKMLKHVSTRWLSIGKCLERLLTNWEPLKSVFKQEVADKTLAPNASKKASKILETLRSRSTRLYIMFLSYTIKLFDSFLTVNQSDSPKAHKMQNSCRKLIRDILVFLLCQLLLGEEKLLKMLITSPSTTSSMTKI